MCTERNGAAILNSPPCQKQSLTIFNTETSDFASPARGAVKVTPGRTSQ